MPIIASQIVENTLQQDGRRWIVEEHKDSTGKKYKYTYLANVGFDVTTVMKDRVAIINKELIDNEISVYLNRIKNGLNVIGLKYTETSQDYRALKFFIWTEELIQNKTFESLRYAYKITEQYTEDQINTLLSGTQFENKASKIKFWEDKLRDMDTAMSGLEYTAEEV